MRSAVSLAAVLAIACRAYAASSASRTSSGVQEPSAVPTLGAQIVQGCFSSQGALVFNSTPPFNSKSACAHNICYAGGFLVAGNMGGNECFCGDEYPSKKSLADDSHCNVPCPGFGEQACGGINYWTIYNTGIMLAVNYASDDDSSSTTSATSGASATESTAASTTIVSGGETSVVYVTASATPTETKKSDSGSSTNTAGIAAGVVVGAVVLAAACGGGYFYLRRKRNREIEEEHRRNAAVNAFMGGKPPSSSGGYSIDTDSRLDPVMAQRRMSSGSIADNQDYSRRILRVTNA